MFVGLLKWPKNSLENGPAHFRVRANLAGLVAGLGW